MPQWFLKVKIPVEITMCTHAPEQPDHFIDATEKQLCDNESGFAVQACWTLTFFFFPLFFLLFSPTAPQPSTSSWKPWYILSHCEVCQLFFTLSGKLLTTFFLIEECVKRNLQINIQKCTLVLLNEALVNLWWPWPTVSLLVWVKIQHWENSKLYYLFEICLHT